MVSQKRDTQKYCRQGNRRGFRWVQPFQNYKQESIKTVRVSKTERYHD